MTERTIDRTNLAQAQHAGSKPVPNAAPFKELTGVVLALEGRSGRRQVELWGVGVGRLLLVWTVLVAGLVLAATQLGVR